LIKKPRIQTFVCLNDNFNTIQNTINNNINSIIIPKDWDGMAPTYIRILFKITWYKYINKYLHKYP